MMLNTIRWILLTGAVVNLLGGTVLYRPVGGPLTKRWWSYFERSGASIPAFLQDDRVIRSWAVITGAVLLIFWWYLGTADGTAAFEGLLQQAKSAA